MEFSDYATAWRPRLVRTVVLLGHSSVDAEDIAQTALLNCYRNWHRVVQADRPEAYAFKILVNAARDAKVRRLRNELPSDEALPGPTSDPDITEGLVVRAALREMSHAHREVLVLRYYCDLSERETATVLGLPLGTIKSRTARALSGLQEKLKSMQEIGE